MGCYLLPLQYHPQFPHVDRSFQDYYLEQHYSALRELYLYVMVQEFCHKFDTPGEHHINTTLSWLSQNQFLVIKGL